MITVICATHRPQNQTLIVMRYYLNLLREMGQEASGFEMDELPLRFLSENTIGEPGKGVQDILERKIRPARRLVVIAPEYNGSYPGLFKAFVDSVPPSVWRGKKAALVGVASGRAGNLRGMDHLTDVFHHLRVEVFSYKLPISRLDSLVQEGELTDPETRELIRKQAGEFLKF